MIGRFSNLGSYREMMKGGSFIRAGFAGVLALAGYLCDLGVDGYSFTGLLLVLSSVCINGVPIIWGAVNGLIKKKINVDELVSIAIIACLISGEFLTAATVSFVMVLGSLIEEATAESARRAIQSLVKISPEHATIIVDGKEQLKPIAEVEIDDMVLVKPGERIPVDAVIVNGTSSVDESSITGEPIPNEKTIGDAVYSGTLNQNGVLRIRATKVGEDTTLGKVIQLVLEAESHRPESITLIDKYARWFTPSILLCAGIAWVVTGELNNAIAVLIVGCPCALILAAPTAIVATISRAARSGILIKGGQYIEKVGSANAVLFDKTGTLTEGEPQVDQIIPAEGIERDYVLQQAACVEQNSTHPLARAVLNAAGYARVVVKAAEDLFTEIGLGVKGCVEGCTVEVGSTYFGGGTMSIPQPLRGSLDSIKEKGGTPLVVYRDKRPLGIISVSDHIRAHAAETITRLKNMNIKKIGILSGDHEKAVRLIGGCVGATDTWAGLKPQDKLTIIKELQASGYHIIFVGDGINDAPALAASDVGIAMGAKGTEVALETAHIALMHDDISKLPFLVSLSRRMLFTIKWNIVFGLFFNFMAIALSGAGFLTPIMGAVVHNIGSVLVVLSSASIAFASDGLSGKRVGDVRR